MTSNKTAEIALCLQTLILQAKAAGVLSLTDPDYTEVDFTETSAYRKIMAMAGEPPKPSN